MIPELELSVLDELNEGDEQSPGVWSVDNESLQQHPCDLLLDGLRVGLSKQVEHGAGEVVRVTVRVTQLVGDGVQEQVAACNNTTDLVTRHHEGTSEWAKESHDIVAFILQSFCVKYS